MSKKLKVLSVDDDFINLKLINMMLKKNENVDGVIEAENGLEALNILKTTPNIDVILLDIKMPIMNGLEFLANISSTPLKNIPVIVLTTDETKKHEALERGAYDFLVKPIREHELTEKIGKIAQLLS